MLATRLARMRRLFTNKNNSLSLMTLNEKEAYVKKIEDNVFMEYKVYPALPHQDPNSPEYVAADLDEYYDRAPQFKYDLKLQREVWQAIAQLDRPYKTGIKGIDTNLDPNGISGPDLPDLGFPRRDIYNGEPHMFLNEDRFIAQSLWHKNDAPSNIDEWEKERLHRPVTKDYNHSKGYKYDVAVKPEEKYQYLADRLGHPQFFGLPLERLLRLESDIYHPVYLDQPFIKMPSHGPHESLNFEMGEVVYENTRVLEWLRLWLYSFFGGVGFFGVVLPIHMGLKTNLVTEKADEFLLKQPHLFSYWSIDSLKLAIPIGGIGAYYVVTTNWKCLHNYLGQYAVKVSYSKDKELLFIEKMDGNGILCEQVFETAHLEVLPPRQRSGAQDLSSHEQDGLWTFTCLNTQKRIYLYNNEAFWNRKLKDQFINSKLNLWDKSYYGYNRKEQQEEDSRWRQQAYSSINQEALPKN